MYFRYESESQYSIYIQLFTGNFHRTIEYWLQEPEKEKAVHVTQYGLFRILRFRFD